MTSPNPSPVTDRPTLDHWLRQFDKTWEDGRLADYVRQLPSGGPLRDLALVGLIQVDLQHQWARGRRPRIEGYLHCYPELGTVATVAPELILTEIEARRQHVPSASPNPPGDLSPHEQAELEQRFPGRGELLRTLILDQSGDGAELRTAPPFPDTFNERPAAVPPPAPAPVAPSPAGTLSGVPLPASPAPTASLARGEIPEHFGHYRVLKKLGQGGMGTVYLAKDERLDRQVALKIPRFTAQDGPHMLERFYQEVKAAAALDHPNICPVYEAGCEAGTHYMTMAYVEGQPLSARVQRGNPWPLRQAALLIRKLALVVHEAHVKKIVHRDLKPSNIMINQRKEPIIMDFGLARRITAESARLTVDGAALGTPAYMAPEQAQGDRAQMGPCCDVYSLGVMLYELIAGELPFRGSAIEVIGKVLHVEPQPPSTIRPDLDPALEALCLKAMAKNPRQRFTSALELATAIKTWVETPSARPTAVTPAENGSLVVSVELSTRKPGSARGPGRATRSAPRRRLLPLALLIVGLPLLTAALTLAGLYHVGWLGPRAKEQQETALINKGADDDVAKKPAVEKKEPAQEEVKKPLQEEVKKPPQEEVTKPAPEEVKKPAQEEVEKPAQEEVKKPPQVKPTLRTAAPSEDVKKELAAIDYFRTHGALLVFDEMVASRPLIGLTLYNAARPPKNLDARELIEEGFSTHLPALKALRSLDLSHLPVGDKDLAEIARLKGLRSLSLEQTEVSDAGLMELTGLKALETLNLRKSKVEVKGILRFKRPLPLVRIIYY